MAYKKGENRKQRVLFPECIDEYVGQDAPVRFFDAFVDSLDMEKLGFIRSTPAETGTPGYDPRDLMKLYIYGYFYAVRSSRKLARECRCNIEVMWLLCKLAPDFRTISDFRKDNRKAIEKTFKEFNRFCHKLKLFSKSFISIDGSKFKAVNAKDSNFTLNKLDDRIARLDEHIKLYMEELDECDCDEGRKLSKDELEQKIDVCQQRKEKYEAYRDALESSGQSQMSVTDPDAKLMKSNEGFCVGYNPQVAVDAESHLIAGYMMTNNPTDHGSITNMASEVKKDYEVDVLETVADKGYESPEDHANALASGIIPNVIQRNGGSTETVTFEYVERYISDDQINSAKPENLRLCLESGVIPTAYEGILSNPCIREVKSYSCDLDDSEVIKMTQEEMMAKAAEGYFVRDPERNIVYCPMGQTLRQKSIKRNGFIRYCNRLACARCKNKCTKSSNKEVDFNKDSLLIRVRGEKYSEAAGSNSESRKANRRCTTSKVVSYVLHLNKSMMEQRKNLSEHPFGTIKRHLGQYYFLLKGFEKVSAEMSMFCLSYNLKRVLNMRSVDYLIKAL